MALGVAAALAAALCWTLASLLWRRLPTSLGAGQLNLLKNLLALAMLVLLGGCSRQEYQWGWYEVLPTTDQGASHLKFLMAGIGLTLALERAEYAEGVLLAPTRSRTPSTTTWGMPATTV